MTEPSSFNLEVAVIVSRGRYGSAAKLKKTYQIIPSGILDPHRPGSPIGGLIEDADRSAQIDECRRDATSVERRYSSVNGVTLGDAAQVKPSAGGQGRCPCRRIQIQAVGSNLLQYRLNCCQRGNRGPLHGVETPKLDQRLDRHIESASG